MILRRVIEHVKKQEWTAAGRHAGEDYMAPKLCCILAFLVVGCTEMGGEATEDQPYITSTTPLRIVSANDGDALNSIWGSDKSLPDSLTVIDLSPDAPPVTRMASETVPNSYSGAPISAVVSAGQYAFIPNHPFGLANNKGNVESQISVVDLNAPDLAVIAIFPLPDHVWQVMAHPDDERVIAISDHQFHVFQMLSWLITIYLWARY